VEEFVVDGTAGGKVVGQRSRRFVEGIWSLDIGLEGLFR
jgi:hypothetical protein